MKNKFLKFKVPRKLFPFPFSLPPSKGFTLIELLVVISIISILAALLMANFVSVRQRGRDAQRKSDLKQIQSALELYRADYGKYPSFGTYDPNTGPTFGGHAHPIGLTVLKDYNYMKTIPSDPSLGDTCPQGYIYWINGTPFASYTIFAKLENDNDIDATKVKELPIATGNCDNPNACKRFTITGGTCGGSTYNFWVNNP